MRRCPQDASARLPHLRAFFICAISVLLIILAGSALLFSPTGGQVIAAPAATTCPTSLPPTPTTGSPLDASSIKLNEILTNPKKDWNCDGKADASDQWIELMNMSGNDESLFGLQLASQGQAVQLNSTDYIGAHSFLVIFSNQIPLISLLHSSGQLELLDPSGTIIDAVNYPALGVDQSYAREANGQWQATTTPTPGSANIFTTGAPATPTPTPKKKATPTKNAGGGGSSGGGPIATPTPFGSVFIPTDTPTGSVALQNSGDNAANGSRGNTTQGTPSWLKIALIALIGLAMLGVGLWYFRSRGQEPEDGS